MNLNSLEDIDQMSHRQPTRPKGNHRRKYNRSKVVPLRRFLVTQVGRLWNNVYSDICAASRHQSPFGERWVDDWTYKVETDVSVVDGVVSDSRGIPLGRNEFYVDPASGILQVTPPRPRSRRASTRQASIETVAIDSRHKLAKVGENWFVVTIAPVAPDLGLLEQPLDVILAMRVHYVSANFARYYEPSLTWGHNFYACHKRSASSAEIKRGLSVKADAESSR